MLVKKPQPVYLGFLYLELAGSSASGSIFNLLHRKNIALDRELSGEGFGGDGAWDLH